MIKMTSRQRFNFTVLAIFCFCLSISLVDADLISYHGVIKNCKRSLALLEPDVVIYTNDIDFKPDQQDEAGHKIVFQYVVAVDYEDTLVSIEVKDATALH